MAHKKLTYVKFLIATLVATVLALTAHIYVQRYTAQPLANIMSLPQGSSSHQTGNSYPLLIDVFAYSTAFFEIGLVALIYYYAGDNLPIKNKFIKGVVLGAIICEIKGYMIRDPLMNFVYRLYMGAPEPLKAAVLIDLDKWVANIFLGLALVYLCPTKKRIEIN